MPNNTTASGAGTMRKNLKRNKKLEFQIINTSTEITLIITAPGLI